tara:strand:- start:10954 stop:11673 length:720 start_codon:yes stop_codon:yes gene_type:complete
MSIPTIVTGASSGIGKATAELIIKTNNKVLGLDIANQVIFSPLYEHIQLDISNKEELEKLEKKNIFFQYQGLVNAAGITLSNNNENKFHNFDKTLRINLQAPYYLSEIFYRSREKPFKTSSIVNISSIGAPLGFPNNPGYCSSKGGLEALTRALSVDFINRNIRVNSIRPGYTETPMNKRSLANDLEKEKRGGHSILNRWGIPEEIAETILFLISSKASFITGSCLTVDGGWTVKGINL